MGGRRCEGYGVCSDAAQQHFANGKMLGGRSAVKKVCRTFLTSKKGSPFFQGLPLVRFYKKFQSLTSISRPNSLGRKRGQTFSDRVITEAASLVPICMASSMVFP